MSDVKQPHWMQRNWKWFVPVGCLSLLALAAAALVGFFFLIMGWIQSSDVYQLALEQARTHPELIEALGEPIEDSFITTGSISTSGSGGQADLKTYLQGPQGGARLFIVAEENNGVWTFQSLTARVDSDDTLIDLLADQTTE